MIIYPIDIEQVELRTLAKRFDRLRVPIDESKEVDFMCAFPAQYQVHEDPSELLEEHRTDIAVGAWRTPDGQDVIVTVHFAMRELYAVDWLERELEMEDDQILHRRRFPFLIGPAADYLVKRQLRGQTVLSRIMAVKNADKIFRVEVATNESQYSRLATTAFYIISSFGLASPSNSPCAESLESHSLGASPMFSLQCPASWHVLDRPDDSLPTLTLGNKHLDRVCAFLAVDVFENSMPESECRDRHHVHLSNLGISQISSVNPVCVARDDIIDFPNGYELEGDFHQQFRCGICVRMINVNGNSVFVTSVTAKRESSVIWWSVGKRAQDIVLASMSDADQNSTQIAY